MSLANSCRISYKGEVLCCLDQTEVKAVEPYRKVMMRPQNVFERCFRKFISWITGVSQPVLLDTYLSITRIHFKDGTKLEVNMPFMEFINAYC